MRAVHARMIADMVISASIFGCVKGEVVAVSKLKCDTADEI